MNVLRVFLLFLFVLSCQKSNSSFEAQLYVDLFTTFEVEKMEQALEGPPATWQTLMRFKTFDEKLSLERVFCLNYQIPYEKMNIEGELHFERIDSGEKCHPGSEKNLLAKIDKIKKIQFHLYDEQTILKGEQKEFHPFTFYLHVEKKGEDFWYEFPLMNLERGHLLLEGQKFQGHTFKKTRYASSQIKRILSGVQFLPPGEKIKTLSSSLSLDTIEQKYQNKNLILCHGMKRDCTETQGFSCEECRTGWFEVTGARCKGGYIKFCGVRRCGGLDEPACQRGTEFSKLSNLCFEGSNAGFCAKGLHTYCDENNILICK